MSTSSLRLALLGLCGLLAVSGCDGESGRDGSSGADVAEAEKFGGTAVVASYSDLQSMNSLVSSDNTSNEIQRQILFAPLIKYNEEIEPIPWLAERWDTVRVAPDSLEITFHLRRDIKWHDGQPTTAEDVQFTFDRAVDPKTAFPNASAFDLYSHTAQVVDPYTIKFRLKPHSDFLDIWYQTPVMPKHILGDVPPEQLLTHPFGTQNPVGNGPFRFVRRTPGQEWVFEANPDFPPALGGRPYLDRLVYRNIPEQTTLLTEILTGGIDVYLQPNPNQADQIKAAADVELLSSPFRQWNYIAWNTQLPMFSDARVRRALTMAIDRQGIVDALVYGHGDVGRSTITPAHWSYDPNDPQTILPYDTAAARRLLAEAGWMDRNNNGVLENEQGREFRFTLKTNQGNDLRKDITEIVQAQLRPLGIVVEPRLVEWNTLVNQLQGRSTGGSKRQRDFEAVVSGWVDYFRKDDTDILHSKNVNNPFQYVQYSNPRADQLIDTLGVMMDREQAMPLWKEYQHLMVQESPYTPIYYPRRLVAVRKRMQGVETDIRGDFSTVTSWWILPSQRAATPQAGAAGAGASQPATDTAATR